MLDKLKKKITEISKDGVTIPIKPKMLEQLIKNQSDQKDVKVEIASSYLVISGTNETNIPYKVTLKPIHIEKRVIVFETESKEPAGMDMADLKVFNSPPFSEPTRSTVKMDFDSWDIVKKIPVGKIKSYEMTDGTINLTISL